MGLRDECQRAGGCDGIREARVRSASEDQVRPTAVRIGNSLIDESDEGYLSSGRWFGEIPRSDSKPTRLFKTAFVTKLGQTVHNSWFD